ncbi:MAG: hypothetical protein SYR96_30255 [Actinomycetota bacterium]|nr:hypothetical protein [Actinomycetota bacterium]
MQDASASTDTTSPEEDETPVLAEILPGIAVVFGDVPAELKHELIDFGLVPADDRLRISNVLATLGNTATVAGNVGTAYLSAQGLFRLTKASRDVLAAGGRLAVKDGANLGGVFHPITHKFWHQVRFKPVESMGAMKSLAGVGPALAMVALQMTLNEITTAVRTNIALTNQVLKDVRHGQWAELTALVSTIDVAIEQAREIGSVPTSLWDTVAGKRADLQTQLDLYRLNVGDHIKQIQRLGKRPRREYLEINAEAIAFDAYALLSSLKAWTGYQALHAARARAAGPDDAAEAQLVESIAAKTGEQLKSALAETTKLVGALRRELRMIAEFPARDGLPLPGLRRDGNAARETSARLLEALEPLAEHLHPAVPPLEAPEVVCAPESQDLDPALRILRWLLDDGEALRVIAFAEVDDQNAVSAIFSGAKEKLASQKSAKTLIVVTDQRILTARSNTFLEQGEIRQEVPVDQVRYVRAPDNRVDLITRDENISWQFGADIDAERVGALAGVLAESMSIPDAEHAELLRRRPNPVTAG